MGRPRLFTLEEARALLERVRPLLEEMSLLANRIGAARQAHRATMRVVAADGFLDLVPAELEGEAQTPPLAEQLRFLIARLGGLGIDVKDPARGLIDFPHLRDGELVYLCYELPEATIEYWHRIEDGYAGRARLDE